MEILLGILIIPVVVLLFSIGAVVIPFVYELIFGDSV